MLDRGLERVVAVAPEDAAGERALQRFAETLRAGGGSVLREARYTPDTLDFTALLEERLGVSRSRQRVAALQALLGEELGVRLRADDDIDALFIAAEARSARLLVPQLGFIDVEDLPVVATERVVSATGDAVEDRDLDGVWLTLPAWQLGGPPAPRVDRVADWYPEVERPLLARLFALGRDSLLLAGLEDLLRGDPDLRLRGASGLLWVEAEGSVRRDLDLARYRRGRLQPVADAPAFPGCCR
jgi:outer membrane PBP1 activator LpoA protein